MKWTPWECGQKWQEGGRSHKASGWLTSMTQSFATVLRSSPIVAGHSVSLLELCHFSWMARNSLTLLSPLIHPDAPMIIGSLTDGQKNYLHLPSAQCKNKTSTLPCLCMELLYCLPSLTDGPMRSFTVEKSKQAYLDIERWVYMWELISESMASDLSQLCSHWYAWLKCTSQQKT